MAWQSLFMSPCLPLSAPTPPSDATAAAILFLQQNALPALGGHSRSTSPEHHPSPSPFRCCCASIASELPRVHAIMASPFRLQLTVSLVALVVAMASSAMGIGVLKSTYNASTELDGSAATLHWTLSPSTIQLALVVKAPSVVTTNASALWVGFGIGDPQSGGMVGADIVTAEYGSAAADGANCEIVDRHVPMVAYPLGSGVGGEAIFPVPDDCPTKQSWVLIACSVDPTTGMMTLEASRSLAAPNPAQDRDIVAGRNILMYAYGDGFAYHGAARRSVEVDLTASGVSAALAGDLVSTGALPPDADDSILLTMPNYTVSTNRTDYACATFELDPPAPGTVQQMVAAEAVIDLATSGGRLVHHLVVLSCDQSPEFESFKTGKECLTMLPVCTEQVFGYALSICWCGLRRLLPDCFFVWKRNLVVRCVRWQLGLVVMLVSDLFLCATSLAAVVLLSLTFLSTCPGGLLVPSHWSSRTRPVFPLQRSGVSFCFKSTTTTPRPCQLSLTPRPYGCTRQARLGSTTAASSGWAIWASLWEMSV